MTKEGYVKEATEYREIPLINVPRPIETRQLQYNENQLAGLYMTQVFIESDFRTNSNLN